MRFLVLIFLMAGCSHLPPKPLTNDVSPNIDGKAEITSYKKAVQLKKVKIQSKQERDLVLGYLRFLEKQKPKDAKLITHRLIKIREKSNTQIETHGFGLFKNNSQLVYKTNSLATISVKHFLPLLEEGNQDAIELFLVYSASVQIDNTEIDLLKQTALKLEQQHPDKCSIVLLKHQKYFQKYPSLIF
jgi:hypothetical protein